MKSIRKLIEDYWSTVESDPLIRYAITIGTAFFSGFGVCVALVNYGVITINEPNVISEYNCEVAGLQDFSHDHHLRISELQKEIAKNKRMISDPKTPLPIRNRYQDAIDHTDALIDAENLKFISALDVLKKKCL